MQDNSALGRALSMVRDLRRRCPWDRIQTRETLRPYLIEEVFELDHALSGDDTAAIRDEVSDLLLHLAWQLIIAEERGEFSADEVAGNLERKMRRRHPHLFEMGPPQPWERLKRDENRRANGTLDGLPPSLPVLSMAFRLQERAAGVGFDWPDTEGPAMKVREELVEVEKELESSDRSEKAENAENAEPIPTGEPVHPLPPDNLVEEIGDLLFAVVNLARKARVHPDLALDRANRKFRSRFQAVERLAADRGIDVCSAGLAQLDELWEEVKG
jgi:ATP diphosphatase